ncbi:MAG: NAD-binding protein, partial [Oculatellaceae cyanobacterium Prado106]|nr:NAD-binding protein [Oculatellaceae cyanobacterium Prado106]
LITSRFDFLRKRPPIPKHNHVVLVGVGRLGQRIADLLQTFRQPFVAITEQTDLASRSSMPILLGNPLQELPKANLAWAKSIIVVTDDQMLNLEIALLARNAAQQFQREIGLVVRTYDQRFSDNLSNLLPDAKALAAYALSAEAFAGAAFGENILSLFRLNNQTILVTEYLIRPGDTLIGKLLSQISYGYSVVPILHQENHPSLQGDPSRFLLPPDERVLEEGDRLVILSSINGLRRIEHGDMLPPRRWRLRVEQTLNQAILQEASSRLFRIAGCSLEQARALMEQLPGEMELELYDYQAHQLEQELGRLLPTRLWMI